MVRLGRLVPTLEARDDERPLVDAEAQRRGWARIALCLVSIGLRLKGGSVANPKHCSTALGPRLEIMSASVEPTGHFRLPRDLRAIHFKDSLCSYSGSPLSLTPGP